MKGNWEADILALTYEDYMEIRRTESVEDDETGITEREEIIIANKVKCSISQKQLPILNGETNNILSTHAVYCYPDVDVKQGDLLIISRLGDKNNKQQYIVGDIFPYISHLEIAVQKKERV